jgi:WD40-like Beta Propeller Repeat
MRTLVRGAVSALCAVAGCLGLAAPGASAAVRHEFLPGVSAKLSEGVPSVGPHGEAVPVPGALGNVNSMTVDSGELYVAESASGSRIDRSRIDRFNGSSGAFVAQFPKFPSLSLLQQGLAVGHSTGEAQVYVPGDEKSVNGTHGVVAVLSPAGSLLGVWKGPEPSNPPGGLFECFECEGPAAVAVDGNPSSLNDWAAGDVYVTDLMKKVVDVFKPAAGGGETLEAQLVGPEPPGVVFSGPRGVAVNQSNGELFVTDREISQSAASNVYVFKPAPIAKQYEFVGKLTVPGRSLERVKDVTVDGGNGDVYVNEGELGIVDEFNAQGEYVGRLTGAPTGPSGEPRAFGSVQSVAVDPVSHDVYVGEIRGNFREPSAIDVFGADIVIPDVATGAVTGSKVVGEGRIEATLNGTVNPDKEGEASCLFVWGTSSEFGQEAKCEPEKVADGGVPVAVHARLSAAGALAPDTTYHYRLEASNKNGTNAGEAWQDGEFTTPGPGLRSETVSDVASTSVTFNATVNPHGAPTSYYFQYGTSTAYGSLAPGTQLGSGEADVEVSRHVQQGLSAGTVYHYRVVAVSELAPGKFETFAGPDETFTTQTAGGGSALLDGRSWELVSPADKHGALMRPIFEMGVIQAAAGGGAMTFVALSPTEAQPPGNDNLISTQVLSTRGSSGWVSRDIQLPHETPTGLADLEYRFFSEDLSSAVVQPLGPFIPASSPLALAPREASEQTPFLRTNYPGGDLRDPCVESCYRPLVTGAPGYANVPPGTVFGTALAAGGGGGSCPPSPDCGPRFVSATPDASHVVFESYVPLASGANGQGLYEWSGGRLALVSVLPEGEGAALRLNVGYEDKYLRHAVSDDGSRVVWSSEGSGGEGETHLNLRDVTRGETVRLDAVQGGSGNGRRSSPVFQGASSDGSRVFFADSERLTADSQQTGGPQLYECKITETAGGKLHCSLSDLTPSANLLRLVTAMSQDGSWVYFVSNGVLVNGVLVRGARQGNCQDPTLPPGATTCNLYAWHDGTTRLVAVLSGEESNEWGGGPFAFSEVTARVSPSGRWLAFMSQRELTGYNTHDVFHSGKTDEEVYLYDANAEGGKGRLVCASCNPTGARPVGVEYEQINGQLAGGDRVWSGSQFIAANVPGWTAYHVGRALYQSRYLSDSGRLFFNSSDALVPQDVNGEEDVYEYEPPGVGGCTAGSVGFSERSGGCVGLVSSGGAAGESAFLDASEKGGDVFFLTGGKLAAQDYDTALDVYDAHECTSSSPCFPAPLAVPPPCVTGDSCKPAPSPQPPIYGAPASATFSGKGNVTPSESKSSSVGQRGLARARKLARALRACGKKRDRHRRLMCQRHAKRRFGAVGSGTAIAKRGGGR